MIRSSLLLALILPITAFPSFAGSFKWTGVRNPCKVSAEDGVTKLSVKIGKFSNLESSDQWLNFIHNVNNKFPGSRPWATFTIGNRPDSAATNLTPEAQEAFLTAMDQQGIDIFLELWPKKTDVLAAIDQSLSQYKEHRCVKGLGVDLEYYNKAVDDATAQAWDEKIKSFNPQYRLFLKHWQADHMPKTYRGKGDLIFICTSSEESVENLNTGFAKWAATFAPAACAFQIGYPADEDAMDGTNTTGWWKMQDPIKEWGDALLSKIGESNQELGLLWVCVKSSKSYHANWDLTGAGK